MTLKVPFIYLWYDLLGCPVQEQELYLTMLMGPFQLKFYEQGILFCSIACKYIA